MVHMDAIWIKVCFPCALIISRISKLLDANYTGAQKYNEVKLRYEWKGFKGGQQIDQSNPFHQNEIQWKQIIESTLL